MIVEHWACRDDMGLLAQLRDKNIPFTYYEDNSNQSHGNSHCH